MRGSYADVLGDHAVACPRTGLLARRGKLVEHAWTRPSGSRSYWAGGAGRPSTVADTHTTDPAALAAAECRKQTTYPELLRGSLQRLAVGRRSAQSRCWWTQLSVAVQRAMECRRLGGPGRQPLAQQRALRLWNLCWTSQTERGPAPSLSGPECARMALAGDMDLCRRTQEVVRARKSFGVIVLAGIFCCGTRRQGKQQVVDSSWQWAGTILQQQPRRLEVFHGGDALRETVMFVALESETPQDVLHPRVSPRGMLVGRT